MRDPRYGASVYAAHHCSALNHAWNVPQDCSCEAYKSAVTRQKKAIPNPRKVAKRTVQAPQKKKASAATRKTSAVYLD